MAEIEELTGEERDVLANLVGPLPAKALRVVEQQAERIRELEKTVPVLDAIRAVPRESLGFYACSLPTFWEPVRLAAREWLYRQEYEAEKARAHARAAGRAEVEP